MTLDPGVDSAIVYLYLVPQIKGRTVTARDEPCEVQLNFIRRYAWNESETAIKPFESENELECKCRLHVFIKTLFNFRL